MHFHHYILPLLTNSTQNRTPHPHIPQCRLLRQLLQGHPAPEPATHKQAAADPPAHPKPARETSTQRNAFPGEHRSDAPEEQASDQEGGYERPCAAGVSEKGVGVASAGSGGCGGVRTRARWGVR